MTKKECEDALKRNKKHPKQHKHRKEKRFYHCNDCNMWHLTSKDYNVGEVKELTKLGEKINKIMGIE